MRSDEVDRVLGLEASVVPLLERCFAEPQFKYAFMCEDDFLSQLDSDVPGAMQTYWREILARCHWSAVSSLLRTYRWTSGILEAYHHRNLVVFAACCRGLLEACADSDDSLNIVPHTLAQNVPTLRLALWRRLETPTVLEDLEQRLLHFTHARRRSPGSGELARELRARTAAEYLAKLKKADPRVAEYYQKLCEITHPNAMSVLCFARYEDSDCTVRFDPAAEAQNLEDLRVEGVPLMPLLMALGVTTPLLILKVLNAVAPSDFHTPFAETVRLDAQAWLQIEQLLRSNKSVH